MVFKRNKEKRFKDNREETRRIIMERARIMQDRRRPDRTLEDLRKIMEEEETNAMKENVQKHEKEKIKRCLGERR